MRFVLILLFIGHCLESNAGAIDWVLNQMGYRIPTSKETIRVFGTPHERQLEFPIKVLQWNTEKAKAFDFFISDAIHLAEQSDLVLFQEVQNNSTFAQLLNQFPRRSWSMAVSYELKGLDNGVMTGSPVGAREYLFMRSMGKEAVVKTPKISLITRYKIKSSPSKDLLVANIHALNFTGLKLFSLQITKLAQVLAAHSGPLLVAGDFNTWTSAKKNLLDQTFSALNLKQIHFASDPRRYGGMRDWYQRNTAKVLQLDHAYIRGLRVEESRVLNDTNSSDHYPLAYTLDLTQDL